MSLIVFDPAAFRAQFKAFENTSCYPNITLEGWFEMATAYISAEDNCCYMLSGAKRALALNLLTAHIGTLFKIINEGETPGVVTSATIDKVSVSIKAPPDQSQFQAWLSTTPWGQQLNALLQVASVGGFYVGGVAERNGFRRAYGGFGGVPPRRGC